MGDRQGQRASAASPAALAVWQVGEDAALPTALPALGPGVTTTLTITWPWPSVSLSITLSIDPGATLQEVTRANNVASQRSDALYLAGDGAVLRRWSSPTDGHRGSFNQPAGLAVLPNGDALVADAGNGRVVRIVAATAPGGVYLPQVRVD